MHSQFYRLAELKRDLRRRLRSAQVSPRAMTALYTGLLLVLDLIILLGSGYGVLSVFIRILCWLISIVLGAGFVLYCMAIRRGERSEYLTLFDGFSFAGRLIALNQSADCALVHAVCHPRHCGHLPVSVRSLPFL